MTHALGKRKKRGMHIHPSFPGYFFLTEALLTAEDFPFDARTVIVFTLPALLTVIEALADARFILSPPFAGMKESYGPGEVFGEHPQLL